jgi:hypothetical protein
MKNKNEKLEIENITSVFKNYIENYNQKEKKTETKTKTNISSSLKTPVNLLSKPEPLEDRFFYQVFSSQYYGKQGKRQKKGYFLKFGSFSTLVFHLLESLPQEKRLRQVCRKE